MESLFNAKEPLDIAFLDNVVKTLYEGHGVNVTGLVAKITCSPHSWSMFCLLFILNIPIL